MAQEELKHNLNLLNRIAGYFRRRLSEVRNEQRRLLGQALAEKDKEEIEKLRGEINKQ